MAGKNIYIKHYHGEIIFNRISMTSVSSIFIGFESVFYTVYNPKLKKCPNHFFDSTNFYHKKL